MTIKHQQPARNIGLQWNYLKKKSFDHCGILQLEHVEIVYKDIGNDVYVISVLVFLHYKFSVYNGLGEVLESPVNTLVPEAFPNKNFRVSAFRASGLLGFLQHCLPPCTSTSKFRRDQQVLVIVGAVSKQPLTIKLTLIITIQDNTSIG